MIWVIGGTAASRMLIDALLAADFRVIVSVVTEYGASLLPAHENLIVHQGALDAPSMIGLCETHAVRLIVDASHPYASAVKENVFSVSLAVNIPLLTLGRRELVLDDAVSCESYAAAAEYLKDKSGNVLLAIGSKNLSFFKKNTSAKMFARVLPLQQSIAQCAEAGFAADRIIALQFAGSVSFETALLNELSIRYVVTKESGAEGGVTEKAAAARAAGAELLVVKRPPVLGGELFYDIAPLILRAKELLHG